MYSLLNRRSNNESSTIFNFKNISEEHTYTPEKNSYQNSVYLIYIFLHLPFILISVLLFLLYISLIKDNVGYQKLLLKKIPSRKYFEVCTKYSNTCTICMEYFENDDDVRILRCYHVFHMSCIDMWLNKNISCPVCRASLEKKY